MPNNFQKMKEAYPRHITTEEIKRPTRLIDKLLKMTLNGQYPFILQY